MTVSGDTNINSCLQKGDYIQAVKLALKNCEGVGRKHPQRSQVASQTLRVLLSVKTGEIDKVIGSLDLDQIDVLMKYIYYGFENPVEASSTHLLTWHDKACDKGGVGSIVRVLTEH